MVPGNCEFADTKPPQNWNASVRSPPLFTSPSWEPTNFHPAQNVNQAAASPGSTASVDWETNYPTPPRSHTLSVISLELTHPQTWELPTITHRQSWDATVPRGFETIDPVFSPHQKSSVMPLSTSWEINYPSPPQTNSPDTSQT